MQRGAERDFDPTHDHDASKGLHDNFEQSTGCARAPRDNGRPLNRRTGHPQAFMRWEHAKPQENGHPLQEAFDFIDELIGG